MVIFLSHQNKLYAFGLKLAVFHGSGRLVFIVLGVIERGDNNYSFATNQGHLHGRGHQQGQSL